MFPTYTMGRVSTQALTVTPVAITLPARMNVQSLTIRCPDDMTFHFEVGGVGFPVAAGSPVTLPFDPAIQTIYLAGTGTAVIAFSGTPQPR
jgi:hypothetical protein